jgi:hypothetical protein
VPTAISIFLAKGEVLWYLPLSKRRSGLHEIASSFWKASSMIRMCLAHEDFPLFRDMRDSLGLDRVLLTLDIPRGVAESGSSAAGC